MWENKRRRPFVLFQLISKGDENFRGLSHNATNLYSEWREKGEFFVKKQIPLHTKNLINKTEDFAKEKAERYLGNIRNTRLLKDKNAGISEFFKNLDIMEKENAEAEESLNPTPEAGSQNTEDRVK